MTSAYQARLHYLAYMKYRSSMGKANRSQWLRALLGIMHTSYYTK